MNWRIAAIAIIACFCVAGADDVAARTLVVRSVGPSAKTYPPGKALPDTAKISLQQGDSVTVVGGNSARTLRGPGTFPAAAAGAQELAMAASRRSRFGAMRSGELALNPSPWNLDVTQSGTICAAGKGLKMWRPNSEQASKMTITKGAGPGTTINWPAGKSTIEWPSAMPINSAEEYQLMLADGSETQKVRFAILSTIPTQAVDAAEALVERGCQNQLDVLVDALREGE
jgi:hypothetical protein